MEGAVENRLGRNKSFDDNVFDFGKQLFIVDAIGSEYFSEASDAPLGSRHIFIGARILLERLIVFVDRVVCEVHVFALLVIDIGRCRINIRGGCEPGEPLFIHVNS